MAEATDFSVTIILTNYNHAGFLPTSLDGIVNQTLPADEVIVIDDGSTDESLNIISSYARVHKTIKIIENIENKGVQFTIARALENVTKTWVVWAAADDCLRCNFIEENINALKKYPEAGLAFSQMVTFHSETGQEKNFSPGSDIYSHYYLGDDTQYYDADAMLLRLSTNYLWISGNTVMARKDYIDAGGGFIPKLQWHSDWFAFYVIALRYGAVSIPKVLASMRVLPETYSSAGMNDPKKQRKVMNAILDILRDAQWQDIRKIVLRRACILSPFNQAILKAILWRPKDWVIAIGYREYTSTYRLKKYTDWRRRDGKGYLAKTLLLRAELFVLAVLALRLNKN